MTTTDGLLFCRGCGGKVHPSAPVCPHCGYVQAVPGQPRPNYGQNAAGQGAQAMGFGAAIATCLRKFAVFEGRAARPEYWYFYLFCILLSIGASLLKLPDIVSGAISFALLLPSIGVTTRRLHDIGRNGWNQLWVLTGIGIVPVVYWLTRPGEPGPNRFGPPPPTQEA